MVDFILSIIPIITILIIVVAVIFLVSGVDDLLMDLAFVAWRVHRRLRFMRRHRPLTRELLLAEAKKPVAIMIPAWEEQGIIGQTLDGAVGTIAYDDYTIFVGVYPNDPETRAEVEAAAARHPGRIALVDTGHPGPTSKADCLNAIIRGIWDHERNTGRTFAIFAMDDAEDIVSRYSLLVFNYLVPRKDFVQLPVFPAKVPWWHFTAGHYIDEFAQLHVKDMRTREWLTGAIPSAGVGAAFSRRALLLAQQANKGEYFSRETLTEDYELPLQLVRLDAKEAFVEPGVPIRSDDRQARHDIPVDEEYPYVRSYFPDTLWAAVRQKTRWVLGISLQGWAHLGWHGGIKGIYMLWRDRKALLGNLANFAGYVLVFFTVMIWLAQWGLTGQNRFPSVVPAQGWVWTLLLFNLLLMALQLVVRFACTSAIYGPVQGLLSVPRAVWGNLINFLATARALVQFFRAWRRGERNIPWDKTEHQAPSA